MIVILDRKHVGWYILLCIIQTPCAVADVPAEDGHAPVRNLRFSHLTTNDGLSQGYVTAILQDRRGFMWFATRDGLNRYDGNTFVVYKHNPNDPGSLSSNFIEDLVEDDHGYLWISTNTGVNKFDPLSDRFTRYFHDPKNPNSIGGTYITRIARDRRGCLWFGTQDSGLDKFDPATGRFTHYRDDSDGRFVGRINHVVEDSHGNIWFVGDGGLFRLNQTTGQITRPPAIGNGRSAESLYADEAGNLWMLANSATIGLLKYDLQTERLTNYPIPTRAAGVLATTINGGSANSKLVADGQDGLWVPSSEGLYYFDRRTQRFTYRFQHDESNPDSLDTNAVMSVYRDRGGVLWVGTENAGLNVLNFRQEQFVHYMHRPSDANSLSPGRVKAIYQDPTGVLWLGFFPRALNRLDRKTGGNTQYTPKPGGGSTLGTGTNVNAIYRDSAGYLWVGGGGSGLDRFDERTGRFKHYRHNPVDPNSLASDNVVTIYQDRSRHVWVGGQYGLSRFDSATDGFTNYRPVPTNPASLLNWIWAIYEDRSGTLWLGTFGGALIRFDDKTNTFMSYTPDSRDPHKLNGAGLTSIHEDRTGTLWVGAFDGLYRFNRQSGTFARFTEVQGLASSTIRCIQEDGLGRLWLSTQKGVSRFDPALETFRNYDVSDGLQSNEFSDGCNQGPDGEVFFGGSNGFNAFFPERIRDDSYVPPVSITSFKIFNKPVPIGAESVLKKAIPYIDSLTLSYQDNVFSFEFAALSYANSHKNRYRYMLEGFDRSWNEVSSKQRLAIYTNLDPDKYVFRVQGSNSDGVWNEQGVSLPILITPPWYRENWFVVLCAAVFLAMLWAAYRFRVRQLHHEFNMRLEGGVEERMRIARELHDTLLQSFQGLMFSFQAVRNLLPERTEEAVRTLDHAIHEGDEAIAEGRDAIQGLRADSALESNLEHLLTAEGKELAKSARAEREPPAFQVTLEGAPQPLSPLLQDEVYRIAREILRNAFRHSHASRVEAEVAYDSRFLRLRIRDNGKGIDRKVLEQGARQGHWGLPGVRERAKRIGAQVKLWSEPGAGTEAELTVPARIAYRTVHRRQRLRLFRRNKV
ncbi:MAG TPA: two-component regulator propeller domain-containing protein [Candidatus Acidoferrales bacterium]|nr:two-component regulator propeller domain-containing protein [Candidatus Acidoferrales bacterium]